MRNTKHEAPPDWVKDGAHVWFQPIVMRGEPRYAGVVDGEPWQLGHGEWVVNLREMDPRYEYAARRGHRVVAACMFALALRGTREEAVSSVFLNTLSLALSGRSYPNCELAGRSVRKIADPRERSLAEQVVLLVRDWIDQSYRLEGRDPAVVKAEVARAQEAAVAADPRA